LAWVPWVSNHPTAPTTQMVPPAIAGADRIMS
jgi:hypothetical protein